MFSCISMVGIHFLVLPHEYVVATLELPTNFSYADADVINFVRRLIKYRKVTVRNCFDFHQNKILVDGTCASSNS